MKIILYNINDNKNTVLFERDFLVDEGHEVTNFTGNELDKWCSKHTHFQVFQNLLDFAERDETDLIYFETLAFPEYLLSELSTRKNLKSKIVFTMSLRGSARSKARAYVFTELIKKKQVKKVIIYSLVEEKYLVYPDNWKCFKYPKNKVQISMQPKFNGDRYSIGGYNVSACRKKFNLPKNKFIVTLFGRGSYSRGPDIMFEAAKRTVDKNIHYFVHCSYIEDKEMLDPRGIDNLTFVDNYCSEEEIRIIAAATDVFAMPFRDAYAYGGSGIPTLAAFTKRPMIIPDIHPFDILADEYKLGTLFESGNVDSFVKAVKASKEFYKMHKREGKFEEYFSILNSDEEMASNIIN